MEKRIVIAGCRDYKNYEEAKKYIDYCISKIKTKYTLIFVSGGCRGADSLGERYALENGYKVERYLAEWDKYGKSAGPKRNEKNGTNVRLYYLFLGWGKQGYKIYD